MATEKSLTAVIRASRPSFRNSSDKVAFAVHASFLAAGYVLNATGPPAFSDDALSSPSTDEVGIDHWNEMDGDYAFVYVNPEKSGKKVLVKCLAMNDKLMVDALADGASEPVHLELDIGDYVEDNGAGNYSAQFKNLDKLVKTLDSEILSKLYGSDSKPSTSISQPRSDGSRNNINEPSIEFTEPVGPQIHPSGVLIPPINPLHGGDIFPGPAAGVYPTRDRFGSGDNMLIGPNDPRWFGGEPGYPGFGVEPGYPGFGGQPGVPPGSRFDPYGPPGVPGFEPGRFVRNPRRPGRGGIHPDLEQFRNDSDFI